MTDGKLKLKIAVIDGQGGGIGKVVVEKLKKTFAEEIYILALGTNSLATSLMLKAGANAGATGENAVMCKVSKVDIIVGPVAIVVSNSLLGELTPKMAQAVSDSDALKILIPLNRCRIEIAGSTNKPLPHYVDDVIHLVTTYLRGEENV
jgi:hypothetical protein